MTKPEMQTVLAELNRDAMALMDELASDSDDGIARAMVYETQERMREMFRRIIEKVQDAS